MDSSIGWLGSTTPLIPFFISVAIYSLALDTRRRRWLWLAPLLYLDHLALKGSCYWTFTGIDSLWGLMVCIWVSHSLSVLFLEDEISIVASDKSSSGQHPAWFWKAWETWNNPRLLSTTRAENFRTPPVLAHEEQKQDPEGGMPSLCAFTAYRSAKLVIYWVLCKYVQPVVIPGPFVPLYLADFDESRQTFLRRLLFYHQDPITLREISLRTVFAFFWAVGAYILVDGAHAALSLLFVVVLGVNRPHEWPPIYGSIYKASSLRGFWGRFWHRLVVIPYGNVGRLLAGRLLRFEAKSLPYKLIVACCIFVLSGIVHAVVAWQLGDRNCWHLDIWWFFLNFLATTAESFVCGVYRSLRERKSGPSDTQSLKSVTLWRGGNIIYKCLGFVWVFFFFFWSVPKWQYPKVYSAIMMELQNLPEDHTY